MCVCVYVCLYVRVRVHVCVCVCVCTCRYNLFLEMMAQVRRNCIYSVYQFKPEQVVQPAKEEEDVKAEV